MKEEMKDSIDPYRKYVEDDLKLTNIMVTRFTPRPNPIKRIRWYFRHLFRHIQDSFKFFRTKRFFRKESPILVMIDVKHFDRPNMYIGSDMIIDIVKRFKIDPKTLDNLNALEDIDGNSSGSACIGFSPKSNKWYGWSHRAIHGFGIGDVVSEGDLTSKSGYTDEFAEINPEEAFKHVLSVGFTAKTLEDAKKMAIAYAASVS